MDKLEFIFAVFIARGYLQMITLMIILTRVFYKLRLYLIVEYLDFKLFLRLLRRLPVELAEGLSCVRGYVRYILDLDWKSTCLGYPFMRDRTGQALVSIFGIERVNAERLVISRFIHQSREEYEAMMFSFRGKAWPKKTVFDNLEPIQQLQQINKGIVFLTAHFDSSIAGSTFIGDLGYNVNIFYDDIVFDRRVKTFIQEFFREKYSGMQSHFNSGIFISARDLRSIYRRLKHGEIFIWLSDVMNTGNKIVVSFLGHEFYANNGPLRVAMKTDSALSAYITEWLGKGEYKTTFMTPVMPNSLSNPEKALQDCYDFMSQFITKAPERWWIVDTSLNFKRP